VVVVLVLAGLSADWTDGKLTNALESASCIGHTKSLFLFLLLLSFYSSLCYLSLSLSLFLRLQVSAWLCPIFCPQHYTFERNFFHPLLSLSPKLAILHQAWRLTRLLEAHAPADSLIGFLARSRSTLPSICGLFCPLAREQRRLAQLHKRQLTSKLNRPDSLPPESCLNR